MRWLYALFVNFLLLLFWPLLEWRRRRAVPAGAWVEVEIDGEVSEVAHRRPFWDRRPRPVALHALRRLSHLVGEDPRVQGLLLTIKNLHGSSATASSVRDVIAMTKKAGKQVAVHLPDGAGTRDLYIASAADLFVLGPETHVAALGFAVQAPYVKEALEKIGVEPDVFARGKYKTAAESLVLSEMSEAQREQVGEILDASWDELVESLAAGRRVDREVAREWVDQGPWSAERAVQRGIADVVCFPDQIGKKLSPKSKDGAFIVAAGRYVRRRRIGWRRLVRPRVIGVVELHGAIVSKSPSPVMNVAEEESVGEALARAREDHRVKGVIVHVDSRGGSALASSRILHDVRRLAEEKPVVAYFGDTAASGGYMVGCGAQAIVAQPTTITGSIGVVAARPVVRRLLERLGVAMQVVKRGARADMMSPARHLSDGEREAVSQQIEDSYQAFLQIVSEGRGKTVEEVDALAGGRVYSGRAAAAAGLLDELGGFDVALARVRKLIGDGADALEPALVASPRDGSPITALRGRMLAELGVFPATVREAAGLALATQRERVWAWCDLGERDLGYG